MRDIQYKNFSWEAHQRNWQMHKPNICQFELTFACGLHCKHCYTDCYNRKKFINKELKTPEVKDIIDKLYKMGVLWICFTGGDPLTRNDFLDIYSYTKKKGFIVSIFTNGYSMTEETAGYLAGDPPFVIELTLNAVTLKTYEAISGVAGSYKKVMHGLELILQNKLPLKVKTMATRQNYHELRRIKEFLAERKIKFRADYFLFARLNQEDTPCKLRLSPAQVKFFSRLFYPLSGKARYRKPKDLSGTVLAAGKTEGKLFRCAAGGSDGINLDPYGRMFVCCALRKPAIDFLNSSPSEERKFILDKFSKFTRAQFKTRSECRSCKLADFCRICPGKKYLEIRDWEKPIEYFCQIAKEAQEYFVSSSR